MKQMSKFSVNAGYVTFLAQGGYGWVAMVYDDAAGRSLAVKCTQDTSQMELNWWPKLEHENILPLLEYITLDSCTIFIMPAMRKDIWVCINEPRFYEDELSFGICRIWLRDVATGLNYLHQQHLCHLDIKLDNIFLKENGHVCVGDFSLLSDTREVPEGFHFLEMYEPPEYTNWCHGTPPSTITAGGKFGGDKADMWQFGILAIDLLTDLKLTDCGNSKLNFFHHDVWPFVQKVLHHQEYLEYLLERTFRNVLFNDLDFDQCHGFLHKILCLDPNSRISAEDAMKEEFVKIEWPQLPKEYSIPTVVLDHPVKNSLQKEKSKIAEEMASIAMQKPSKVPEVPSKVPDDVLKQKMELMKQKKMDKREVIAAEAGKRPAKILSNISTSRISLAGMAAPGDGQNPDEKKYKFMKLDVIPSTILSTDKKLVAKATGTSEQLPFLKSHDSRLVTKIEEKMEQKRKEEEKETSKEENNLEQEKKTSKEGKSSEEEKETSKEEVSKKKKISKENKSSEKQNEASEEEVSKKKKISEENKSSEKEKEASEEEVSKEKKKLPKDKSSEEEKEESKEEISAKKKISEKSSKKSKSVPSKNPKSNKNLKGVQSKNPKSSKNLRSIQSVRSKKPSTVASTKQSNKKFKSINKENKK